MTTAWFLMFFWITPGVVPGWFSVGHFHPSGVAAGKQSYDSKAACLADIDRVEGLMKVKTDPPPKPGDVGFVCVEGVIR